MFLKSNKAFLGQQPSLFFKASIRLRLTALFVCIFGATLIFFSALLYQVFSNNHMREFDAALYNYTIDISTGMQVNFFGDLHLSPREPFDEKKVYPFSFGKAFFQVIDVNGAILARSANLGNFTLPISTQETAKLLGEEVLFQSIYANSLPEHRDQSAKYYRLVKYLTKLSNSMAVILLVAVPMTLFEKESNGLLTFLWIFVPVILILSSVGGWIFADSALKPIKLIINKARNIEASNLADRLPVPTVDDEIRHLSITLNDLLERIQKAFQSQDKFIADISHELKTPLAILRGEIDLIKQREDDPSLSESLESARQEITHLSELVENLLLLSRVDAGISALSPATLRFDELVLETVARTEVYAKSQNIRITIQLNANDDADNAFQLKGDSGLLQCLVKNLVENAIKFSDTNENVEVIVTDKQQEMELLVRDFGKGISETDLPKIFEIFYRGEGTHNTVRGSGLGLHLAKRIVDIHNGSIQVNSMVGKGSTFQVSLPKQLS